MCLLITQNNITRLETHPDQLLGLLEQLARQNDDKICRVSHLCLLLLAGHHDQLGRWVHNLKLAQYGRRIRGKDHFLEVVYDNLVAAIGTEGRLDCLRDRPASVDVADNSSIFCIVAGGGWLVHVESVWGFKGGITFDSLA